LLGASPEPTIAYLRKRLTAVPMGDTARIEKLVGDLQKAEYNERKKAMIELRKIGVSAVPQLRQAAERNGEDLVRRLLYEFESQAPPRRTFARAGAGSAWNRIGTDEARKLLEELAKGAPEAPLTVEAKAALERATKGKGGLDRRARSKHSGTAWQRRECHGVPGRASSRRTSRHGRTFP